VQRGGTIIAVIPAPREAAERIAGEIVRGLDDGALDLHDSTGGPTIRLACGIIAFSFAGQAAAGSVQAAGLAPGDFGTGLDRRLDEALSEAV